MDEPNPLNIPAYQRKRSLSAKARRKPKATTARKKSTARSNDIFTLPVRNSEFPTTETVLPNIPETKKPNIREMKVCGQCDGYFEKINVAIIKVTSPLRKGDTIIFEKKDGLFEQMIESMQINHKDVSLAKSGSDIGLKVPFEPIVGGNVYKVL